MSTIVLKLSTGLTSVGDLLFGQTRGRVLAILYGASEESFFIRQIARQVETSVGTVSRELNLLADAGLIKRSAVGSRVFCQANQEHPDFPELRALVAKTTGVFQLLKTALAPLSPRIKLAFVYGSVARGEDKAASDIDLMVIGAISLDERRCGHCENGHRFGRLYTHKACTRESVAGISRGTLRSADLAVYIQFRRPAARAPIQFKTPRRRLASSMPKRLALRTIPRVLTGWGVH